MGSAEHVAELLLKYFFAFAPPISFGVATELRFVDVPDRATLI